jgi:hypothetical protein
MKYIVTVAQLIYGEIEIEANDREEAKEKALHNDSRNQIEWLPGIQTRVAEVERLEEGIENA